jgi:hypothetical protein
MLRNVVRFPNEATIYYIHLQHNIFVSMELSVLMKVPIVDM